MNAESLFLTDSVDPGALTTRFREMFGAAPRLFRAPGRVNLIGEHTDYNDGFVMPAALNLYCWVAAAPRAGRTLVVHSINARETVRIPLGVEPAATGGWRDYVAGVAALIQEHGTGSGASLLVHSDVPAGAGLSSSAALEVATATALLSLWDIPLDPAGVARLCQRAENEVVGAGVGIMDPYAAVHARYGSALMLDCRALRHWFIPLPPDLRILVCDSMVRHSIASGEYNRRRAECAEAVATISRSAPAVRTLRDVDAATLEAARERLGDRLFRRARHVVTENLRVEEAAVALERADLARLGVLMAESHRSLRDDYEVSVRELDILVDAASGLDGVYGARLTGAGFGGCTVNLVHRDAVEAFRAHVTARYKSATHRGQILIFAV